MDLRAWFTTHRPWMEEVAALAKQFNDGKEVYESFVSTQIVPDDQKQFSFVLQVTGRWTSEPAREAFRKAVAAAQTPMPPFPPPASQTELATKDQGEELWEAIVRAAHHHVSRYAVTATQAKVGT
jgi:hypothetical protein